MKKRLPTFASDEEAERFVETADLTNYDLTGAAAARVELERKERAPEHAAPSRTSGSRPGKRR